MLRHRAAVGSDAAATLVVSARTADLNYRQELEELAEPDSVRLVRTLTRGAPRAGRVRPAARPGTCSRRSSTRARGRSFPGRTGFVEAVADLLVELRLDPAQIKPNDSDRLEADVERVDGNAVGGVLGTVFAFEVTEGAGALRLVRRRTVLAEAHVYGQAPGSVIRCSACEAALAVVVEAEGRIRLGLAA